MKIFVTLLVLILVWSVYNAHQKSMVYIKYLRSVGIPDNILSKMKTEEIKSSAIYLKRYAKTNQHFTVDDPDYNILADIRLKYGIFA